MGRRAPPTRTEGATLGETGGRITLRLPQSMKAQVDEFAAADGLSTNAWLVRA